MARAAPHVMSDHILLAAATVSGLASEALHPLLALRRQPRAGAVTVEKVFLAGHVLLSLGLAALVCGESFYTARLPMRWGVLGPGVAWPGAEELGEWRPALARCRRRKGDAFGGGRGGS